MTELAGRTAFVTGSTSGIGTAIARAFAAAGARVIVHGLEEAAGRELARELTGRFVGGDLSDPATPERLAAALAGEERLDVLVNNAGIELPAEAAGLDQDVLDRLLRVNLVAPTQLVRRLLPRLREHPGASVLNLTSMHASVPVAGNVGYAMAKAALDMYTRTAAIELGPAGVRVNAIAPGAIETPMNAGLLDEVGRDRFARWIPLGRLGTPADVAGAAVFLASDAARYISGATVLIDGAYSHHLVRY